MLATALILMTDLNLATNLNLMKPMIRVIGVTVLNGNIAPIIKKMFLRESKGYAPLKSLINPFMGKRII